MLVVTAAASLVASAPPDTPVATSPADPLTAEIARWSSFAHDTAAADEIQTQARQGAVAILDRAQQALGDGRRLLALLRLAAVRFSCEAAAYVAAHPAQHADLVAFETEWSRVGRTPAVALRAPAPQALAGVSPAAVRAIGEASLFQSRVYYEASLDYGRSTEPVYGLYYLGSALGQHGTADLCRRLSTPTALRAPAVRPIADEIDALQAELLSGYRPPASIDRHPEFIGASAMLKEARELDAAGLRHGALLRYLQAALRAVPLRANPPSLEPQVAEERLRGFETRLEAGGVDHSVGRLFLEYARDDIAFAGAGKPANNAVAIAADVLPRYFAAIESTSPAPARAAPRATVTLVRWPYT